MADRKDGAEAPRGQDPYGTPPYGRPGPWAPAPPVGHPTGSTPTAPTVGDPPTGSPPAGYLQHTPPAGTAPTGPQAPGGGPSRPAAHGAGPHPLAGPAYGSSSLPGAAAPSPSPGGPAMGDPGRLPRYDPWAPPGQAFPGGHGVPYGYPGGGHGGPGAPAEPPGDRSGGARRWPALVGGAVLVALAAGLAGGATGVYLERGGGFSEVRLSQFTAEDRTAEPGTVAAIAEGVLPGVVTLHVRGEGSGGTGTGFVLDEEGHVLTNAHVVAPARNGGGIQVTFHQGEAVRAELVGLDSGYDLAVVKVSGVSGLNPLPLGDSDGVLVGDPVVAVGSPFELDGTVTSGIISATDRPITAGGESDASDVAYVNALQTDAPINPGNSGGPLLDAAGRVVGINSAIRTPDAGTGVDGDSGGSVGLGFAIPVNQATRIAEELINTGRATHPVLGVHIDTSFTGNGARVGSRADQAVLPNGPGEAAGIEDGDVITAVDGDRVRSGEELIVKVRSHRPDDVLTLTIDRDGEEVELDVVLGESASE